MNPIVFFLALLGVFALLNMYISKRLISKLDFGNKTKLSLKIFLLINLVGIAGYLLTRYYIDVPNWLYFLFSIPIGILFLLFSTAVIYDISRITLHYTPISTKRRLFFKKSLDISALAIASGLSLKAMYEARHVELEKVNIKIKGLQKNYKIVQLSDIHIGGLIDAKFIREIVERVNALKPDLVVITGDLVDMDIDKIKKPLEELKGLHSLYGTFFIVGNHEYFHGIQGIIDKVKSLGIHVLENENVYIGEVNQGFNLAGVYDIFGYRVEHYFPKIDLALKNKQDAPTILLAHQPKFIEEVKDGVDLILSGHTHGGQLFPFQYLVQLQQPYISGLHQHTKELQIYVNKGTGFWGPPMRLGASSEITEITISS
jgi:predicted MPP superfamily phosphohydrolase